MATIIDKLKDKLGNYIYPITSTNAVYSADGLTRLDNKLAEIDTAFEEMDTSTIPVNAFTKKNSTAFVGNLNDLTAGITWCASNATNVPIANSGYCTTTVGITGYTTQLYITGTTNVYYSRVKAGGTWGSWLKLPYLTTGEIPIDAFTRKNITTFGGDVRTLTPGITWCNNSCTNLPVTDDWGLMIVTAGDTTQTILHLEFRGITKNTVYTCTYVNSIWTPWTCVSSDRIISTSVTAGTYCSNARSNLEQAGRMAHISLDILLDRTAKGSDFPQGYTICTLPIEYRPLTGFWVPCIHIGYSNTSQQVSCVQIDTNGNVRTGIPYTANCYVVIDTTFMTR